MGFDISGTTGTAYATLTLSGGVNNSTLVIVNLASGTIYPVGGVAHPMALRGIAIAP